jgi:hypothetical protein
VCVHVQNSVHTQQPLFFRLLGVLDQGLCSAVDRLTHNGRFLSGRLFELIRGQETGFSSGISNDNASLLGGLDIRLEVASNAVADRDKRELDIIKDISMLGSQLQQALREPVVVLLLLDGVVESRMAEVFFPVGNEKGFQLRAKQASKQASMK